MPKNSHTKLIVFIDCNMEGYWFYKVYELDSWTFIQQNTIKIAT